MNKNNIKRLEKNLIAAQERLEVWLRQIIKAPVTVDHVCEVTEEIFISLEELGVSLEEIYQQQEQLAVANRKVEEERQRYLELFEYAPDGYIITNKWGVIQEANQTAADMFNRRQDFIIGKPLWVFITQSHRPDLHKLLQGLEKGELIRSVELAIQPSYDASTFTAAISIAPIKNPQSELIGLRWLLRDISQLKKAQAENARQQKRSQLLAEVTLKIRQSWQLKEILKTAVTESQKLLQIERVLIFHLESDNSGKVLAEASSTQNLYLQDQNLSCTFLSDQSKKQDIVGVCQAFPEYYFAPTLHQTELSKISPQPEFTNLILPIFVHQKLWGFLSFQRHEVAYLWEDFEIDMGEQLANQIGIAVAQAEFILKMENLVVLRTKELTESNLKLQQEIEQRLQIEKSLRHSKEQLYLIADSLPVLIAYVDHNQCYQFNNRAYEDWFGQSLEEICGSPIRQVLGETAYKQIQDKIETVLSGQEVTFEMQIPYQNTSLRWVKVTYIPHKGENSKVIGFFVLSEDINDHKEMEQIKDEFISVVSHELRTPLTAIHGSLKLLNSGKMGSVSEKSQVLIGLAEKNTDRLVRLVNDILDLQRMDSGKRRCITKKFCDATDLIATAVETMKQLATEHKIILEYKLSSIPLIADPDNILQTLTNLISNAIKFSPAHSTILIQAEAHPNEVLFKVKDQGRGIPANKLETIFERFQQLDVSDSRNKQGTGLGLAICRQIIELHQGKIWAENNPDKGSTFYFTLPNIKPSAINRINTQTRSF